MKEPIFVLVLIFGLSCSVFGQSVTIAPGNWSNPAIWSPVGVPNGVPATVNHAVQITTGVSATPSSISIGAAGSINVNSGGILVNAATAVTGATFANLVVAGEYRHGFNGGTVPTANWQSGSTCRITGITSATSILGLGQAFHHFIWDCAGQTAVNVMLAGALTTVNGDLIIQNTNITASNIRFVTLASAAGSATIQGNMEVRSSSRVVISASGAYTLNVNGSLLVTSNGGGAATNNYSLITSSNGNLTLNVAQNFSQSGTGIVNLGGAAAANTNLFVKGNFSFTSGGLIRQTSGGAGVSNIRFNGTSTQTFTGGGTFTSTNPINFIVESGAILDLGTQVLNQNPGAFTCSGTVRLGSLASTDALTGNIPFLTPMTFNSGSTIVYSSLTAAQFMGSFPTGTGITARIENSNGVTLTSSVAINGSLVLQTGPLNVAANTLTLGGSFTPNTHFIGITPNSSIVINGSGLFGNLPLSGSTSISNFTVNRTALGSVNLQNDLSINGVLNQNNGSIVLNGNTLTINSTFTRNTGSITGTTASSVVIQGSGVLPAQVAFSGSLNTLELNRTGSVLTTTSVFTVNNLKLVSGQVNATSLLMEPDGLITRYNDGSIAFTPNSTGFYNVFYANTSNIVSGPELPSSTDVMQHLEIGDVGSVTLINDVIVNGNLTLSNSDLLAGAFTITLRGDLIPNSFGNFSSSTIIFDGDSEITGSNLPELGNIQLNQDRSLLLPAEDLNIAGNINFDPAGLLSHNAGTIVLTGPANQSWAGGGQTLYNIRVDQPSSSGVLLTGGVRLENELNVVSASDFNSNGFLTLLSTSDGLTGNARIAPLLSGALVSGDVTVQRYMSNEGRIWRYISSPVTNATVADLKDDDFPITGTFDDPSSGPGIISGNPSFYQYDETLGIGLQAGWVPYPTSGLAFENPLEIGRGYSAFIRNNTSETVWDLVGPVNQDVVDFSSIITYFDTDDGIADGWNLVGNPYPSTILWSVDGWSKNNVSESIAVRDSGAGTGAFQYWDGQLGGTDVEFSGRIATGQGFWIRTTGDDPTLTLSEDAKTVTGNFFRESSNEIDHIQIILTKGTAKDYAYFRIRENALPGIDNFDAPKLENDLFDLSTLSLDATPRPLAINATDKLDCSKNIKLVTKDLTNGSYVLSLNSFGKFNNLNWFLKDNFTQSEVPMISGGQYSFAVTSNAASKSTGRFELIVRDSPLNLAVSFYGNESVCSNQNSSLLISSPQLNFEYQVEVNGNLVGETVSANNQTSLLLELNKSWLVNGSNLVRVRVSNSCQSGFLDQTLALRNVDILVADVLPADHCGDGQVSLKIKGAPMNATFRWYETMDAQNPVGVDSVFTTPLLSKSKTYYASVLNELGCEGERVPVTATIIQLDDVAISQVGDGVLGSNYPDGNQWYFNGELIQNASSQILAVSQSGTYTVVVTKNGCSTEGEYSYVVTGAEPEFSTSISIYPNPVQDQLTIELPEGLNIKKVDLLDNLGRQLVDVPCQNQQRNLSIKFTEYAPGIYLVRLVDSQRTYFYRVAK